MSRILTLLLVAFLAACAGAPEREGVRGPNIVVVMVDDMGYSDIGCYGGEIETPNLDRLAAGGIRFTQFYNTGRCCPTRAALLTGLYPHQAGIGHMTGNYGISAYQGYLNDRCETVAEALRRSGYTTLMAGKWHVGGRTGQLPRDRGFDHAYGTPTGGVYFKDNFKVRKNVYFLLDDEKVDIPDDWYVTDAITEHAMRFVADASKKGAPFFLYLAHIAPHWPLQARKKDIDKYRDRYGIGWDELRKRRHRRMIDAGIVDARWPMTPRDSKAKPWADLDANARADKELRMAVYAAQIDSVDQNIGRLIDTLKSVGRFDDTLILFLADNGGCAEIIDRGLPGRAVDEPGSYTSYGLEWANASNTPFRRYKHWVHEGGIATPLIAHWPRGITRRGELEHQPGHVIDLMPTCLDVAGGSSSGTIPLEGRSLLPAFRGETIERDAIYWEHEGNRAVRSGKWKLVSMHPGTWELFDLETDRTEMHDLSEKNSAKKRELQSKYEAWAKRAGVESWPVKRRKKK